MSGLIAAMIFSGFGYFLFSDGLKNPAGAGADGSIEMLAGILCGAAAIFSFGFAAVL